MEKNLVITGLGAVTPLGTGTDTYWTRLTEGFCGIDEIRSMGRGKSSRGGKVN